MKILLLFAMNVSLRGRVYGEIYTWCNYSINGGIF